MQELAKVYHKELCSESIYCEHILSLCANSQANKWSEQNKWSHEKTSRGNTEILLSSNFTSLSIAIDADQCCSFTRFHHNSIFTMIRFHHDIMSRIVCRKDDPRFHTAVRIHARVRSSRALNFPESRRREPVRTSLCFWPKREKIRSRDLTLLPRDRRN